MNSSLQAVQPHLDAVALALGHDAARSPVAHLVMTDGSEPAAGFAMIVAVLLLGPVDTVGEPILLFGKVEDCAP